MEKISYLNRSKPSSKTRSEPRIFPGKELESKFNSNLPPSSTSTVAAGFHDLKIISYVSLPAISFKHRLLRIPSTKNLSHRKHSSRSALSNTSSPHEVSVVAAKPSTASTGEDIDNMPLTSTSVISEDDDYLGRDKSERRISSASSSTRSTTLQELFEADSAYENSPLQLLPSSDHLEDRNCLFSRSLSGFSNTDSSAFSHKTTLGELLRPDAEEDHLSQSRSHRKQRTIFDFSKCKATIQSFRSKWKHSGASSTPKPCTRLNMSLSTPDSSEFPIDHIRQQVIAKRWALGSTKQRPRVQYPAAAVGELSRSPSEFSRQLSSTSASASAHEHYYLSRRTHSRRLRNRTSLPYREQLISLIGCIRLNKLRNNYH